MKIVLDNFDTKRIELLNITMQNNLIVEKIISNFVKNNSKFISQSSINELVDEYEMSSELAYAILLSSSCGLDTTNNQLHKQLFEDYFVPCIKQLDISNYKTDLYLNTINIINKKEYNFRISEIEYQPCELFYFDDNIQTSDLKEIPQIGFFNKKIKFPTIINNNEILFSLNPYEIENYKSIIENVRGNVLVLGLKMGYFELLASQKNSVKTITIIDENLDYINFFKSKILSQFPYKEKITIICSNIYEYSQNLIDNNKFDYIYSNFWNNSSENLNKYLKIKAILSKIKNCEFRFFSEKNMLSHLRSIIFNQIYNISKKQNQNYTQNEKVIKTYNEFIKLLTDNELKTMKINIK